MKFNAKMIESVRPKDSEYTMREQDGFAMRVHPSGRMAWLFIYDFAARRRKMTLGHYPEISLKKARQLHTEARAMLDKGEDPAAQYITIKQQLRQELRVKDVVIEYYDNSRFLNLAESSKTSYRVTFEKELLPDLGGLRISEVKKPHIRNILDRIIKREAPVQAKRTQAHLHRVFNYAVEMDYIPHNPCSHIKLAVKEMSRTRYLTVPEIKQFWAGLDACELSDMYRLAFRLQLVTGQRKGEICQARWSDISWADATWTIPQEVAKNRTRHIVYLSTLAVDILRDLDTMTGRTEYLLPSPNDFDEFVRPNSLDQALHKNFPLLGIDEPFRPHDLRRTCATHLDRLNVPTDIIKRILNHSLNRGVTGVYTQHAAVEDMRKAMEIWASELRSVLNLLPTLNNSGKIIPMVPASQIRNVQHASSQNNGGA